MNGIAVKCAASVGQTISFTIGTHAGKKDVHSNDRFIAIMQDSFKPFVIISSVGSLGSNGNLIDSAEISYQSTGTDQYKIVLSTTNPLTKYILFEINMHEEKLFQDTTVESKQPALNNVYGSIGFIGRSHIYGEQWLYSRLDYSKLSEILDKRIDKVVLYLPQMNNNSAVISAYQVNNRFCSFGSTWDNRIPPGAFIAKSVLEKGYHKLDLTSVFVDPQKRMLHHSEGFIIQQDSPSADFSAIPTGDSCYAPQILQVTYR